MSNKIVYLMRGLPSSGKSHMAARLVLNGGCTFETDRYFYIKCGDDPTEFNYDSRLTLHAEGWNYNEFTRAIDIGASPVVVDRDNGLTENTYRYVTYAHKAGYDIQFQEPDSEIWRKIRILLINRPLTNRLLTQWAYSLERMNRETHSTPVVEIQLRIARWTDSITIEDVLAMDT